MERKQELQTGTRFFTTRTISETRHREGCDDLVFTCLREVEEVGWPGEDRTSCEDGANAPGGSGVGVRRSGDVDYSYELESYVRSESGDG